MSHSAVNVDHLFDLAGAICDETASHNERLELNSMMLADLTSRRSYLGYCQIHAALRLQLRTHRATQKVHQQINSESIVVVSGDSNTAGATSSSPFPSPAPTFPTTLFNSTLGYFSSGWPVAYLVATVICGIGLVIGAITQVSQPEHFTDTSLPTTEHGVEPVAAMRFVGRITGMVDCQWADPHTEAFSGANVPLGRKYALSSGLMEITYGTGTRIILEGPVSFEVESNNGGFLSIGKLTGKVEVDKAKGFSVRTPTATITDLGTEFGVEVNEKGNTTSRVYRGSVRLQATSCDEKAEGAASILHENESARVERPSGNQGGGNRITMLGSTAKPADFVRKIPQQTIKTLDLVDVVAGGDGFSGRRNRGIDPNNGRIVDKFPYDPLRTTPYQSDRQYHRVAGMPFVDGVCIPHDGKNGVQIDSDGHVFTEFGVSQSAVWSCLWAGGLLGTPEVPTIIDGVDYAAKPHGFLYLDANKVVTFDLDAIRRANPGCKLLRFRAVTANTEGESATGVTASADVWVFVDGQIRFNRRDINGYSGAVPAVVSIGENDRFLTLAATDSGNSIHSDFVLFGDPRLELLWGEENQRKNADDR